MALLRKKTTMPAAAEAPPGRSTPLEVPQTHDVNGHRIVPPFPAGLQGCLSCLSGVPTLRVLPAGGSRHGPAPQEDRSARRR